MKIIDFHTHLDERWFHNRLMTHEDFLAGMDRTGIEIACVFTMMGFYEDCTKHNDLLAERASRNADRLIPFITVDPKLGQAAIDELNRCVGMNVFLRDQVSHLVASRCPVDGQGDALSSC